MESKLTTTESVVLLMEVGVDLFVSAMAWRAKLVLCWQSEPL